MEWLRRKRAAVRARIARGRRQPAEQTGFVKALPAAASSAYALAAYTVCLISFVIAGERLTRVKVLARVVGSVPPDQRKGALEIAADTKLPKDITAEEWLKATRQRWIASVATVMVMAAMVVAVVAMARKTETAAVIKEVHKTTQELHADVMNGTRSIEQNMTAATAAVQNDVKTSRDQVITAVQDSSLATVESIFPLAVRVEREMDGTVMYLRGEASQRVISFDHDMTPMQLYWGDFVHYFVFADGHDQSPDGQRTGVELEIRNSTGTRTFPIAVDMFGEHELIIPGSTPEPFAVYLRNPNRVHGFALKIMVRSADRERGREMFREALMKTPLASRARQVYVRVTTDGARLRARGDASAPTLRSLRKDTYARVIESSGDWSKIRLPEGREGWIKSDLLGPIS